MRRRFALDLAFVTAAALATATNALAPGHAAAAAVKLLPMGILIAHLVLAIRARDVERTMGLRLLAGFVASTVGDVVIGYRFVGGIAAFLVAHLAYLAAMGKPRGPAARHAIAALPAVAVGGTMAWILVGGGRLPEPLIGPVVVYMIVISAMLARAAGRATVDVRTRASMIFAAGAATFVTSDALIAIARWVVAIPHPRVAILVAYYAAQRLILGGAEPSLAERPERELPAAPGAPGAA